MCNGFDCVPVVCAMCGEDDCTDLVSTLEGVENVCTTCQYVLTHDITPMPVGIAA